LAPGTGTGGISAVGERGGGPRPRRLDSTGTPGLGLISDPVPASRAWHRRQPIRRKPGLEGLAPPATQPPTHLTRRPGAAGNPARRKPGRRDSARTPGPR